MRSFFSRRTFCTLPSLPGLPGYVKSEVPEIYPALHIHTKELIMYPQKYAQYASKYLKLKTPKKEKVFYDNLDDFLKKQKEEDETHLMVPKEILFLGRSNVGKSSLLNAVFGDKICNVSKRPGTTKTLVFNEIYNGKALLVDAPGYGFADINMNMRNKWQKLLKTYLKESSRLCRIYMLVNMEHGIKPADFEFFEFVNSHNHCIQVVLTKCDKVKKDDLIVRAEALGHQIKQFNMVSPVVHMVSSKKKFGIDMLKQSLVASISEFHSKFELDHLAYKMRLEKAQQNQNQNQNQIPQEPAPAQKLLPPEEMYKLLIKQGYKPS